MARMTRAKVCGQWVDAPDRDHFVICSFNSDHVILRSKMPYHILKCLKQHPNHNKKQCPYDATEWIDPEDYWEHITTCESMRTMNPEIYEMERLRASGDLERLRPTPYTYGLPEPDEDWGTPETPQSLTQLGGMGRGRSASPPTAAQAPPPPLPPSLLQPVKKGMGRGEMLRKYREKYARSTGSSGSSSSSSTQSVPGQFDD